MTTTQTKTAKQIAADLPWAEMETGPRIVFVIKLTIMLCSFGMIYGNIL